MGEDKGTWTIVAEISGLLVLVLTTAALLAWYWEPVVPVSSWIHGGSFQRIAVKSQVNPTVARPTPPSGDVAVAPTVLPSVAAVLAPYCRPGEAPRFVLGFASLKTMLGDVMGQPIECEHANPDNGDSLQLTTTGLAVYRKAGGALQFTDGWQHWDLAGGRIVTWEGDSAPPTAAPPSAD
jgi:hypothetical protein